ncbi:hypothetical protein TanjilG_20932 [Lupinus angustifolius]|uniref:Uncharacterized protein n=1 Tax=Lupinus angustifolius TaxID=3871 RepID=A0A1J7GVH7_LUPAN|nr:hypothetical protein TanjilG_20932 [Lupinus angustifolius]
MSTRTRVNPTVRGHAEPEVRFDTDSGAVHDIDDDRSFHFYVRTRLGHRYGVFGSQRRGEESESFNHLISFFFSDQRTGAAQIPASHLDFTVVGVLEQVDIFIVFFWFMVYRMRH